MKIFGGTNTRLITNHLNKHVWRVEYQLGDKPDEHKYFDAGLPINAVFSKCEIAIKKKRKTYYCIKYLPPEQTCIRNLVTSGQ